MYNFTLYLFSHFIPIPCPYIQSIVPNPSSHPFIPIYFERAAKFPKTCGCCGKNPFWCFETKTLFSHFIPYPYFLSLIPNPSSYYPFPLPIYFEGDAKFLRLRDNNSFPIQTRPHPPSIIPVPNSPFPVPNSQFPIPQTPQSTIFEEVHKIPWKLMAP